ncbi:MAG: FkbM family methyltransferase [Akkermansiaceae bacterium]|nr:FkbM family methyltransferase [Verrucomicrobiales bacterium]
MNSPAPTATSHPALWMKAPKPDAHPRARKWAASFLKAPLRLALKSAFLRNRLAFELKHNYYADLQIAVPLGNGLTAPICSGSAWLSFSQIFFESEYAAALQRMPLPERWLDLGCHAGYFSLYVTWLRAAQGLKPDYSALLVDGDSRVRLPVQHLITLNQLDRQLQFRHGLISAAQGAQRFAERDNMESAAEPHSTSAGKFRTVQPLPAEHIMNLLPPPYDLVKLDIEGGEYDFLTAYEPILRTTRHLLFEWHSWQPGGGGREQIEALARNHGFEFVATIVNDFTVHREVGSGSCGVLLYKNTVAPGRSVS